MAFSDDNQKIVELIAIIEIGVPKAKHARFKTKRGAEKHVEKLAFQFMQRIKRLGDEPGDPPIYLGEYSSGDVDIINDFGYCCYNQLKPSKTEVVYRLFGAKLYSILPVETDVIPLMATYVYTFEGYNVRLDVCGAADTESKNIHYEGDKAPVFLLKIDNS